MRIEKITRHGREILERWRQTGSLDDAQLQYLPYVIVLLDTVLSEHGESPSDDIDLLRGPAAELAYHMSSTWFAMFPEGRWNDSLRSMRDIVRRIIDHKTTRDDRDRVLMVLTYLRKVNELLSRTYSM